MSDWRTYFGYGRANAVTEANVRSKYKKLAVRLHPNKPTGTTQNFQKLGQMLDAALKNIKRRNTTQQASQQPSQSQQNKRCPPRAYERLRATRCAARYLDAKCRVQCGKPTPGRPPTPTPAKQPYTGRCPPRAYQILDAIRCRGKKELNAKCKVKCTVTPAAKRPPRFTKQPARPTPAAAKKPPRFTKQPMQHAQSQSQPHAYVHYSPGTTTTVISPGYTTISQSPQSSSRGAQMPGQFNHRAFRASFPAWMRPHL